MKHALGSGALSKEEYAMRGATPRTLSNRFRSKRHSGRRPNEEPETPACESGGSPPCQSARRVKAVAVQIPVFKICRAYANRRRSHRRAPAAPSQFSIHFDPAAAGGEAGFR